MPKRYDPDTKAEIIEAIISSLEDGKGLATVCRELDFPRKTFLDWVDADNTLSNRYEQARARAADVVFEEILGIQDERPESVIQLGADGEGGTQRIDPAFVSWQKNRVDARKWVLSKMLPKKYGDSLSLDHSGKIETPQTVDLSKYSPEELATMRGLIAKGSTVATPDH